jgi:hypothetical protein
VRRYKRKSENSTLSFNQSDCVFGTNPRAFSTAGAFFGAIHKGACFSIHFACLQCVAPANPYAGLAIGALGFNNVGDERTFFPEHNFLIHVNTYVLKMAFC